MHNNVDSPDDDASARAVDIGRQIGDGLDVPFYTGAAWKAAKQHAAAKSQELLDVAYPMRRWWWWFLAILAAIVVVLSIASDTSPASGLLLLLLAGTPIAAIAEHSRRRARNLRQAQILSAIEVAIAERYEERMQVHLAQEEERLQLEEQEHAAAIRKLERKRAARRKKAIATGVPVDRFDDPPPVDGYLSPRNAEQLVAQWMRSLGEYSAEVTRYSADGGIDVESKSYIAQVKHYVGSVGVTSIRELAGVSATDGRKGLFFTSGSYTKSAITFATASGIALFKYDPTRGTLDGVTDLSRQILLAGL